MNARDKEKPLKTFLEVRGLPSDSSPAKVKSFLGDLSRTELEDAAAELFKEAKRTDGLSAGFTVTGVATGVALGEVVNQVLRLWGKSEIPASKFVNEHIGILRTAPHAALAVMAIVYGREFNSRVETFAVFAGLGLGMSSLLRFADWLITNGDASAAEEQAMRDRLAQLQAELDRIKGVQKG